MPDAVPLNPIFTNWRREHAAQWLAEPVCLQHRLHQHPLFSFEALAELIDGYPRAHYALVEMGPQGSPRRLWREGDIGGLPGRQVIDAIQKGRMWLNLRNVAHVAEPYGRLLNDIFDEIGMRVPGYDTFDHTSGILISSPNAQVYYHCDLPGQSLWQLHGKKRVYVYPNTAPFLTPEQLENIALFEVEVDMRYEPAFDQSAKVFEIAGGEMLHWPLNAPHRVENLDCLNVSMTMEYWTEAIRRRQMINMANGILRHKLGVTPRSLETSGPGFWAKAALQAGVKRSGLLKKARKARRPIEFRLDKTQPGRVIDVAEAAE
ncbi:MAG: hypothetical protein ACT4N2_03085 [Hyphomicrobium sp.]